MRDYGAVGDPKVSPQRPKMSFSGRPNHPASSPPGAAFRDCDPVRVWSAEKPTVHRSAWAAGQGIAASEHFSRPAC
jgi:hypothetical protein